MTRSLGHSRCIVVFPWDLKEMLFRRDPNGKYKNLIAGIRWDIWQAMKRPTEWTANVSLQNGAPELCSIARQRWDQAWTHEPPNPKQRQENVKLPKWNHDDVGVADMACSKLININFRKLE